MRNAIKKYFPSLDPIEMLCCITCLAVIVGVAHRLPSLGLTEKEVFLWAFSFCTFLLALGCFFYLAMINKRLQKTDKQ